MAVLFFYYEKLYENDWNTSCIGNFFISKTTEPVTTVKEKRDLTSGRAFPT